MGMASKIAHFNRVLIILFFLSFKPATAKLSFSAQKTISHVEENIITLESNVRISDDNVFLKSDFARLFLDKKVIYARGNVFLQSMDYTLLADEVTFYTRTQEFIVINGWFLAGNITLQAQLLRKIDNNTLEAYNARYTTCQNCPQSWTFTTQNLKARLGQYAVMKNIFLRFYEVPVLYLPYLVTPLKTERQTGLLTPEWETSHFNGWTISQSFFWAPDAHQDLTITLKNYEKRGMKFIWHYRHQLTPVSFMETRWISINDRQLVFQPRFQEYLKDHPYAQARQVLEHKHLLNDEKGLVHGLWVQYASDNQYAVDFPSDGLLSGSAYLENRIFWTKKSPSAFLSLESYFYQPTLDYNPNPNWDHAVHKFPVIRLQTPWQKIKGLPDFLHRLSFDWTTIWRNGLGWDPLIRDSQGNWIIEHTGSNCNLPYWYHSLKCYPVWQRPFDPSKDLVRSGHRLQSEWEIYQRWEKTGLKGYHRASFKSQNYWFSQVSLEPAHRQFILLQTEIQSPLHIFSLGSSKPLFEVTPILNVNFVPWIRQPSHPFLKESHRYPSLTNSNVSESDLQTPWGLQFDWNDRIWQRGLAQLGFRIQWINTSDFNWQGSLSQGYDFSGNPYLQKNTTEIYFHQQLIVKNLTLDQNITYFQAANVSNAITSASFRFDSGHINLTHLKIHNVTPGRPIDPKLTIEDLQLDFKWHRPFKMPTTLLWRSTWDFNSKSATGGQLKSLGVISQWQLPGNCWYVTISHYGILGGDRFTFVNFDFLWDPQQSPRTAESFLSQIGF